VFISRDPLFEDYPMLSPYCYTANNPMNYVDPTGMFLTNFEDADGNVMLHVEDGSNATFRLTGTNQTNSSFQFVGYSDQGGEDAINMAGLIAGAQDYVMNNYTQCNQAVNFVGRTYNSALNTLGTSATGADAVNYNFLANDIAGRLSNSQASSFDKKTESSSAQAAAASGNLVVGTVSGHVNMVTTQDFTITRYAKNGTSSTFDYRGGRIANVNGGTTTGLGPNKNNAYYPIEYSHVTKFYSINRNINRICLPTFNVRP
jgi:hypothetical protein